MILQLSEGDDIETPGDIFLVGYIVVCIVHLW